MWEYTFLLLDRRGRVFDTCVLQNMIGKGWELIDWNATDKDSLIVCLAKKQENSP